MEKECISWYQKWSSYTTNTKKICKWVWNCIVSGGLKNFEEHDRKSLEYPVVEMWMLLVRAQRKRGNLKEILNTLEKAYITMKSGLGGYYW